MYATLVIRLMDIILAYIPTFISGFRKLQANTCGESAAEYLRIEKQNSIFLPAMWQRKP